MNNTRQIFLFLLLLILYFFLFPQRLPGELVPVWKSSTLTYDRQGQNEGVFLPVGSPAYRGYVSLETGTFIPLPSSPEKGISNSGYISGTSGDFDVYSSIGRYRFSINDGFIPFFLEERLFAVSPDRISMEEWSREGERIWRKDFGSVITSLDSGADYLVLGTLNGNITGLDNEGNRFFTYQFYSARHNAVFSIARSPDRQLAVVSGWPEQTLSFFEIKGKNGGYQLKKTIPAEASSARSFRMFYGKDKNSLLLSRETGNFLYDKKGLRKLAGSRQYQEGGFSIHGSYGASDNNSWHLYNRDASAHISFRSRLPFYFTKADSQFCFIYQNSMLLLSLEKIYE